MKQRQWTTNGNKHKHKQKGVKSKVHTKKQQPANQPSSTIVLKFRLNQPIRITIGIILCIYRHAFMLNKLVNRHTRMTSCTDKHPCTMYVVHTPDCVLQLEWSYPHEIQVNDTQRACTYTSYAWEKITYFIIFIAIKIKDKDTKSNAGTWDIINYKFVHFFGIRGGLARNLWIVCTYLALR